MSDPTEVFRRTLIANGVPEASLAEAEKRWNTLELKKEFEVIGFMAPFVAVIRKSDGKKGSMMFTHEPRFYFDFVEDVV
jgi:hypothetical protein